MSAERPREFAGHFCGLLRGLRAIHRRVQMDALASAGNRDGVVPDDQLEAAYLARANCPEMAVEIIEE